MPKKLTRKLKPTKKNIAAAKNFVFLKWKERAQELDLKEPVDLTNACKFASLFVQQVFGGRLRGNWHHQWVEIGDRVIDLTGSHPTVPCGWPYEHDEEFWLNEEHKDSLASCIPRVNAWVQEFLKESL